jgi:hypothetical protein
MFLFLNGLMPKGECRSPPPAERLLFLPASAKASYACARGMRSIFTGRSLFQHRSQLGRAWGS